MAHILAVDDDKAMLVLIKNALQKDGHEVTCIARITETLRDRLSSFDLILLDVMMPDTDGYTFCREIRDITDCPILFLTAKSMEEDVSFGFSVGADDYIRKPFSIVELRARVNAHLRRDMREKTNSFCVGSVRFFPAKKEVTAGEEKLFLTKSEYEISLLLARNHGQIYSREQISYVLAASFAPPLLKRLFPNAERFLLFLLLFMLLADFMLIALRYARRLNRELQKLAAAAEQIRVQNLLFEPQETRLTELNRVMESLMQLKSGLQHSLEEQWAMQQQKKMQFTALAHDIKTPLAIVNGNAELLAETKQSEEQKEYTAFILEHTAQIHRYVTDMLNLPESDASPSQARETGGGVSCMIKELLLAAAKDVESLGQKKRLSCLLQTKDLPAFLPLPDGDIRRVLANLTDNAVQYSPEHGTVYLDARLADNALLLCVRDEGEGFSKEALAFAAAEFYRGDKSRADKEHFGLGLFITKQIVMRLNGTLRFENAPEGGALVTVSIPLEKEI